MPDNQIKPKSDRERIGEKVIIYKRGKTWWAQYQFEGRQQRESLGTANIKEARRKALIIESNLLQGTLEIAPPPIGVEETIEEYLTFLQVEGRAEKTVQDYRRILTCLAEMAKEKNRTKLTQVDLRFVDQYRKARHDAGRLGKTIYKETVVIRQLINFALQRDLLAKDPLKGLRNPKPKARSQPCWSAEEVERILEAADEPRKSIFSVFADTGMRFGELQWLTWEDVDLDDAWIFIRSKPGWKTKTGESRSIPMTERVREILLQQPRTFRWVFTAVPSAKYPEGGNQISERRLLRSLKRLLKRLGMPLEGKLHTFRHAFVSTALARGIPPTTVRALVGHLSAKTMDDYAHVHKNEIQAAIRKFGGESRNTQAGQEEVIACTRFDAVDGVELQTKQKGRSRVSTILTHSQKGAKS